MEKDVQEKIAKLQGLEQNLQNFLMQRQQFQTQLMEIDSALDEIEKTDSAYKIVGNIMVKTGKEDLKKDLTQKKELMEIRITSLEKQESQLQEKAQELKDEVMKNLKKEWGGDTMSEFAAVIEALEELKVDTSVPKNVKTKIESTIYALQEEIAVSLRASKALHELEDIAEDNNMQPHIRTQIFNVVSLLEMP